MWKIISVSVIALIAVVGNLFLFFNTTSSADSDVLNAELSVIESESRVISYDNGSEEISVPVRDSNLDTLVEIVLTPDDVKNADTKLTIGTEQPYNTKYITEEEVKESISRIVGPDFDLESVEEDYRKHIITLRNVEMVENVSEKQSKVKDVVNEYKEKIMEVEVPKEEKDVKEGEETAKEDAGFFNDPYGNINNVMPNLTEQEKK